MTRSPAIRRALLAASVLATLSLAACDFGHIEPEARAPDEVALDLRPADEVIEAARTAWENADHVRYSGTSRAVDDPVEYRVDVGALPSEETCAGTATGGGTHLRFVGAPGVMYLRGDRAYWNAVTSSRSEVERVLKRLAGKWAKVLRVTEFERYCDVTALLEDFKPRSGTDISVGDVYQVDGRDVVKVTATGVISGGFGTTSMFLDLAAPHLVRKIMYYASANHAQLVFDYERPVHVEEPAEGSYVEFGGSELLNAVDRLRDGTLGDQRVDDLA